MSVFQIAVEESRNDDQIPHDCTLPRINSKKQTLLEGDSTPVHTNIRNEGSAHNNYICRCKDLSEIPSTIFPAFYRKVPSFIGQHTCELNFIQAIVWLKSVTTCISQIPVEKLQQLFDKQRNMCDNHNYDKNEHSKDVHVELSLTPRVNKTPSVHEMLNYSESISSSFKSIFDSPCNIVSPVIYDKYKLDIESENTQNETVSFVSSSRDRNESIAELSKLETGTDYVMINQEERKTPLSKSYITLDLSEDSLLDLSDLIEEYDDVQKHQSFEYEETSSKHSNKRVNNEIIKDENTSKNDAGISNEHRSVLPARSQSIESIFQYYDMECTPLPISQYDVIGKMGTPDSHNSTNFTNYLSNINFSQIISPVSCKTPREQNNANNLQTDRVHSKALHDCNDDNFQYQIDDNSLCTMSDSSTAEKEDHDSAYSTSKIETLNYDTAITTKSTTANKCISVANIEYHYNLRPQKKKEETASPSVIQKPVRKERLSAKKQSSSKKRKSQPAKNLTKNNNFQTDRGQSKTLHDCNNDVFKYQNGNNLCTSMSDSSAVGKEDYEDYDSAYSTSKIEILNYDTAITKSTTTNKCTSIANIEHHYNLRPHKKKKDTASPSVIQKPVRKRRLSAKKQSSSKKRKFQSPKNLTKNNNFQTDRVQSKTLYDCNDDVFKYQNNNSLCTSMSDSSTAEKEDHDSAYSTSKIETLNYDTAITTKSTNKCISVANIGHHYNLQSPKKKKETTSPSLIQKSVCKRRLFVTKQSSPKNHKSQPAKNLTKNNNFQTDRVQSKTLPDYNDDVFKYQNGNNLCTSMSDFSAVGKEDYEDYDSAYSTSKIETLNYDTAITTKSTTANTCISVANIEHHYNLRSQKKKEKTASPSVIQKSVHKRRFSAKKQSSSKKCKLQSAKNLTKNNNFQTDRVQSKTLHDCNDDVFKYQNGNNLCTSMSDSSAVGKEDYEDYDSAYSTSKIETLNYDTAITTKSTTANKCISVANIEHHYNLRPQKKKEKTTSPSVIQKSVHKIRFSAKKQSSSKKCKSQPAKNLTKKNNFQTDRVQSKTLHDCNDDVFKCQNNLCTLMSDSSAVGKEDYEDYDSAYSTSKIETLNYDTAITTKSTTANKCISVANIGHHYNLRSQKKKEKTASPSVIQKSVRKIRFSAKKQSSSKKCKSQPAKNLTKKNNFQTDRVQSKTLHDCNDDVFKYQNNLCTLMSDSSAVGKEDYEDYDSAYSTSKIETLNYDTAITTKSTTANKCISVANIGRHYNLRSQKKEEKTASPSVIQKPVRKERLSAKKQSSSKKRKSQPAKNLTKKEKKNKDGTISVNLLNFTIESELLNSEHVILTSVKVILLTLCDKRTAQKYALHRCWKDSLEEQAINTVLNVADVLRKEKKPDVCVKEIEKTIIETLDEMITSLELNETFTWIYRIQIILQFRSLLSICVKTINYLIAMLQTLQQVLIDATMGIERTVEIEIDQLYLVCYTLDIALRTYRTLVPRDKQFQRAENAILYVGDLWKMRYRVENEELEASFDLDATEKRWMNVLKTFTETSVKHLIQFTNVSYSLYHDILIST